MEFKKEIQESLKDYFKANFGVDIPNISISQINPDFRHLGDYAFNFNALRKIAKEHNADLKEIVLTVASTILAKQEGEAVESIRAQFAATDLDKGFINLKFSDQFWAKQLQSKIASGKVTSIAPKAGKVVLEYCGPNTNKPLHIGHLRNMMLGFSMSEVLKADGYDVTKVNIYNDRGIAICKSIAAYLHAGNGATPQSTGIKGDHFVGDYYVEFGKIVDAQLREKYALGAEVENVAKHLGKEREVLEQETPIFALAKDLLLKWEAGDAETIALWQKMNSWVYEGFNETFNTLGVDFEKDYFESDTYKLGKEIIELGLQKNVFKRRADGAVIIDLTPDGLDEKVVLRSDGTSVYITQDLGTAELRHKAFNMDRMIYVVGNEQDYHFKVLKLTLQKLGYQWADGIYHLSYGMVESPTGRFKSREGKTADADDLIAEVLRIAEERTKEQGKIDDFTNDEAKALYKTIGLGALKFFLLRVNPYKKIIFNPEESIDFHGQTGPFVQYTYARICSIIRKAAITPDSIDVQTNLQGVERQIIQQLCEYENVIADASNKYDPSEIANYAYNLAKLYNKFYGELKILSADTDAEKHLRLTISQATANTIKHAMKLLGIDVPEKM
jgi:arginyl-tRNA synthetase